MLKASHSALFTKNEDGDGVSYRASFGSPPHCRVCRCGTEIAGNIREHVELSVMGYAPKKRWVCDGCISANKKEIYKGIRGIPNFKRNAHIFKKYGLNPDEMNLIDEGRIKNNYTHKAIPAGVEMWYFADENLSGFTKDPVKSFNPERRVMKMGIDAPYVDRERSLARDIADKEHGGIFFIGYLSIFSIVYGYFSLVISEPEQRAEFHKKLTWLKDRYTIHPVDYDKLNDNLKKWGVAQ